MVEFIRTLFSRDFMPHGTCYLWDPAVLWLNVISDGLIALSYYAIPFLLFRLTRARRDIAFNWIFVAFGLFILACGTTHLLGAVTAWVPVYRLDGAVKGLTAIASMVTFAMLIPVLPTLIALPSPSALARINQSLAKEIEDRRAADDEVRRMNEELEARVLARTAELAQSESRFRQLAEALPQMVWVANPMGKAEYYNRQWFLFTGAAPGLIDSMAGALHPQDREEVSERWQKSVRTGEAFEMEYRIRRHDGQYHWFLGRGSPVYDENGQIRQWFGTATDIDDQKRYNESLQGALDRLQAEMDRRQRLEEQLLQSQKMEAIGRLAGGVAHDFNNLLTAILGYTEMLREEVKDNSAGEEYANEVKRAAERATALTNQLLAFGRRQVAQPKIVDLNQIVSGIDKMLRRIIGEDILLQTRLAPVVPPVRVDPAQVDQVIMNLAVNSRDAMPAGGNLIVETAAVEITEGAGAEYVSLKPGRYAVLLVTDTGIGMDSETRTRIFDPFFTTKEVGKGTGQGLAIVYGIVKQNEGEVLVYSEPGQGATFKIYLPAVDAPVVAEESVSSEANLRGTESILLVEDEEVVRNLVRTMLQTLGYRVVDAGSTDKALEILRSQTRIDLLLTDVVMPGSGGAELADAATVLRPGLKVLYMSGYTAGGIMHQGVLDPSKVFLQKPFDTAALGAKVREALSQ